MHSILVPTDFSEEAGFALDLALQIAKKNGSEKVLLFHAVETYADVYSEGKTSTQSPEEEAFLAFLVIQATQKLNAYAATKQSDVKIETIVEVGSLLDDVNDKVREGTVDMIIMGTKAGTDNYKSVNTDMVVRNAKCPVITIKAPVDIENIKNLVMPLDFENKEEGRAIEAIVKLQKVLGAHLHLLRVNTPANVMAQRDVMEGIKETVKIHNIQDFSADIYAEQNVQKGITYFCEDNNINLIMMTAHPKSGILSLFSSSSLAQGLSVSQQALVWTYNTQ